MLDFESIRTIRTVEELAANAWPAEVVQVVGGWRLRYAQGVTRRANSVLANEIGDTLGLEERLEIVEGFYRRRRLPSRFQMCPASQPANLDSVLAARGYRQTDVTLVETADLERMLALAGEFAAAGVSIHDTPGKAWFGAYRETLHGSGTAAAARRRVMLRIGPPAGYALLRLDGEPAAVALGVAERGWLGVFCVATLPAFRRRGAARILMSALGAWGRTAGARRVYLQVEEGNEAARALYAGLGFETLYRYHYREGPAP